MVSGGGSTAGTFRSKANFMKTWKPESTPSNRDRLELYALHKQAVSGDAPHSIPSSASLGEKAKYQAWKTKRGLGQEQAMSAYIAESDRQIRVYGSTSSGANPQTPNRSFETQERQQPEPSGSNNSSNTPRGIAAIPLLCAAAAESRPAYLRRLSRTTHETSWWSRQEPLCAMPGTFWSLPETLLLALAGVVEFVSLSAENHVVQSFFWPLHNCFLAVWMLVILIYTLFGGGLSLVSTLLWGSRRTGLSLEALWRDEIRPASAAVHTLCQAHQRISVRLVGLILLPSTTLVDALSDGIVLNFGGLLASSLVYCAIVLGLTWWYWTMTAPFLGFLLLCVAFWIGWCFALIDLAGV